MPQNKKQQDSRKINFEIIERRYKVNGNTQTPNTSPVDVNKMTGKNRNNGGARH